MSKIPEEINNLYREAWKINRSDPKQAIEIAQKILNLSGQDNYNEAKGLAYKILGASHIWISENDEALKYCLQAIEIFQTSGNQDLLAETYYALGSNYSYLSDFDNALKAYYKCYDLNKETGNETGMADGLNGIGTIYYRTGENKKALDVLYESKTLCEKHNNKDIYIKVLDGLGEAWFNLRDYQRAYGYYEKSAQISREIGNKQVESFALDGLARTCGELKRNKEAEEYFRVSLQIRKQIGFKAGVCFSLLHYAGYLIKNFLFDEALKNLEEALMISEGINLKEIGFQVYEQMVRLYEMQKDYEKSLKYFRLYVSEKEKVIRERSDRTIRSMEIQQTLLKAEAEKKLLETRTQELEQFRQHLILMDTIGRKIISSLSAEIIVKTVHEEVNKLMSAEGFGIGIFRTEKNCIEFPLYIESGEQLNNLEYEISEDCVAVRCFKQKKEILFNDVEKELPAFIPGIQMPKFGKSVSSLIYLPLIFQEKVLGVITVQSFKKNAYSEIHLNLLKNIASYTTIALENASVYSRLEQMVEQRTLELKKSRDELEMNLKNQKTVSELGKKISGLLNIRDIFRELYEAVSGMMPSDCFGIRLLNEEKNAVLYQYEIENDIIYNEINEVPLTDTDNYTVWCITNKKEIFINDNLNEYRKYVNQIRVVTGDMPHSLIFVPMWLGDKVVGAVTVQSFRKYAYTPRHTDILRTLASYTAAALENAYLYRNMENMVEERTNEVKEQKIIIEQKNKDILDSIRYARRIQQAICLDPDGFKKLFPDSFIYYRPKDIVSGDFYWFKETEEWILFAVADCTGHGVPGAFMSLICSELLNRVSTYHNVKKTSDALNIIDHELRQMMFRSQEHAANDGMDIGLCALNKKNNILQFSGAHRPLIIIRDHQMSEHKGSPRSIGGHMDQEPIPFHCIEFPVKKGDVLILTSDGYSDQFGGEKGKKMKFKNFKNLLMKFHIRPMNLMEKVLDVEFEVWKGDLEQVDDVCVMGLRL